MTQIVNVHQRGTFVDLEGRVATAIVGFGSRLGHAFAQYYDRLVNGAAALVPSQTYILSPPTGFHFSQDLAPPTGDAAPKGYKPTTYGASTGSGGGGHHSQNHGSNKPGGAPRMPGRNHYHGY